MANKDSWKGKHWVFNYEWREGEELEWFLLPALTFGRFFDRSFWFALHFLKLEVTAYYDYEETA